MADNKSEMACVYASLILHDDGIPITVRVSTPLEEGSDYDFHHQEDKIKALTTAAGVSVEPYWPGLFAKVVEKVNMEDLISNIGSGPAVGGSAPAGGAAGAAEEAPKEEEKEESSEEEEEMDFDLFD